MLFTYVYTSMAVDPVQLNPDLPRILRASRSRNPTLGITGFLLYVDGIFAQCIEGPADAVAGLADRIERDPAHGFIDVVRAHACSGRRFADWDMGFHAPHRPDDKREMLKILRSRDRTDITQLLYRVRDATREVEQSAPQGRAVYHHGSGGILPTSRAGF